MPQQHAAFQKSIFYIPRDEDNGTGAWASLTKLTTPSCYSIEITPSSEGGSWGTYFYFGSPGAGTTAEVEACGRLLGQPHAVELLVQVVRRRNCPAPHLRVVRHDPMPLQRVEVVHFL